MRTCVTLWAVGCAALVAVNSLAHAQTPPLTPAPPPPVAPAPDAPPADPLVGTILSERYRIIKRLGEGGMGTVYLAEHTTINKKLALKV